MKFLLLASALLCSTFHTVKAEDPSAVLSDFWSGGPIPTVTGASLTSLASGLVSVESTWSNSPQFTSVWDAVYSAAPTSEYAAISSGNWHSFTTQPWFTGVPDSAVNALNGQQEALDSVAAKYISISTSKAGAPGQAQATGVVVVAAAALAAGAVGVMAAL